MSHPILKALGFAETHSGGYLGHGEWSGTTDAGEIRPANPASGEVLATVYASSAADYALIVERAQAAFKTWRTTPAPRRGEAIRLCGEALRTHKDALGSLVALEMGKIKPEGDGEVQEMIDIADFAVGLSRQLYGLTHALGAAGPSDVRAVASARPGRHHLGVQLSGRGVGLECVRGRGLRRHLHLEAVAEDTAVGDRHDEDLQRRAQGRRFPGPVLPVQRRRPRAGARRSSTTTAFR